jgi:hypothetical protein
MGWASFHYDETPADCVLVADTAGLLEITEFRVFQLAFGEWYGREIRDYEAENYFTSFMYFDRVPFWVRRFCHKILDLHDTGKLNPRDFGIIPERFEYRLLRWAVKGVTLMLATFIILLFLANTAGDLMPFIKECYFPPCY